MNRKFLRLLLKPILAMPFYLSLLSISLFMLPCVNLRDSPLLLRLCLLHKWKIDIQLMETEK